MKTNILSFNIELAKKIRSGEIKGRIVTRDNRSVYLVDTHTNVCYLTITNLQGKVEIKYGHSSMLQYLKGSSELYIELLEETSICNNPESPICKVCSNIHCNDCQYNAPKHEFKPFDKVLVRDDEEDVWRPGLYGFTTKNKLYCCVGHQLSMTQCIPYEGHEHLVGTTDKPKEE